MTPTTRSATGISRNYFNEKSSVTPLRHEIQDFPRKIILGMVQRVYFPRDSGIKNLCALCQPCLLKVSVSIALPILAINLQRTKPGNTAKLLTHTNSTGDCCNPMDKH